MKSRNKGCRGDHERRCRESTSLNGNRVPRIDEPGQKSPRRPETGLKQAALEVGYFPQAMGRNVKRNESRTITVIVPDICDPFFSEIIRGIEVTAAAGRDLLPLATAPTRTSRKNVHRPRLSPSRSTACCCLATPAV